MEEVGKTQGGTSSPAREYDYDPDVFAARDDLIDLIKQKVEIASRGDAYTLDPKPRLLVEFFGVPGVGKTWLLEHLQDCFAFSDESDTVSALADFEQFPRSEDWYPLLRRLVLQLAQHIDAPFAEAFAPEQASQDRPTTAKQFVKLVSTISETRTPLLLFDVSDKSQAHQEWLEGDVIDPLLRTGRTVVVFAGRRWLLWDRVAVRTRVQTESLSLLEHGDIEAMLEHLNVDSRLAETVYQYAFGHPLTTRVVIDALYQAIGPGQIIKAHTFGEHEQQIADAVRQFVVEGRFLRSLPKGSDRGRIEELVEISCIPRRIDIKPLRDLAKRFCPDQFREEPASYFSGALRTLRNVNLVKRNPEMSGLGLLPVVRWIMAQNLRMRDPGRFQRWHEQAYTYYQEQMDKYPMNGASYLIEWAFHRSWSFAADSEQSAREIGNELASKWNAFATRPDVQWDLPDTVESLEDKLNADNEFEQFFPTVHGTIVNKATEIGREFSKQMTPEYSYIM